MAGLFNISAHHDHISSLTVTAFCIYNVTVILWISLCDSLFSMWYFENEWHALIIKVFLILSSMDISRSTGLHKKMSHGHCESKRCHSALAHNVTKMLTGFQHSSSFTTRIGGKFVIKVPSYLQHVAALHCCCVNVVDSCFLVSSCPSRCVITLIREYRSVYHMPLNRFCMSHNTYMTVITKTGCE